MKHQSIILLILASLTLGLSVKSWSEPNENPFGEIPGTLPPPPGSEFQEDDDFLDPGSNFGFQPPVAQPQQPPPNPSQPPSRITQPSTPNQPSPPSSFSNNYGSTSLPQGSPTKPSSAAAGKKKAPPKLADYLELDPSIKSLEVKNFDLPDKEIKDVVTLISKWTGKNFIIDQKVRGRITIMGPSAVSLQEAYQAFLSALDANGLTTVQSGKYIRIIDSAEARRAPVKTYAGDYAPKDDQFITRIFQLKFINADEVQREFRDLTTRQGKLFAYEPTNSIIITDTGSNIQRIKEILETLDVKNYETTLHVLRIKNGAAKSIADMLGEIYSEGKGSPGQPRSFRKSALEKTRGGGVISKIIPDEQTNSLVVLANLAGFEQLKQLVGKLDVKTSDNGRIHVYYCEYSKAEDLASTLSSLAGGGAKGGSRRSSSAPGAPGGAPTPVSSGPVSAELEGGVKVTSDAATNSLVITANSVDYQTLKKVIRKLDIPRLQVFVETAIIEVAIDDFTKIGTNLAAASPGRGFAGGFIGDSSSLLSAITGGIPQEGATIPIAAGSSFNFTVPGTAGGSGSSVTLSNFMGLINLLTKSTKSSLLSTPQIIALDNEKAEFQVLDETPVQTSLVAAVAQVGGATGSIERLKTGITIKLTPHINAASKNIRLEIEQKVDTFKPNSSVPSALANFQVATTSRVTNTSVVVRDQDFIMMGGLMSDKIEENVAKVPLLGDIPVLGWLFKSKTYKNLKTNTIILMHPKIIATSLEASNQIQKSFDSREEFVGRFYGSDDPNEKEVKELKQKLEEQNQRGAEQKIFDYRNNEDDDPEAPPSSNQLSSPKEASKPRESLIQSPLSPEEPPLKSSKAAPSKEPPIRLREDIDTGKSPDPILEPDLNLPSDSKTLDSGDL
ncbi:MAG: type II secretion system protein GspD [Deltaproteobacteria bacterium]|nr:type II secretion system protein GspD [Deltaproteobacteria bacterium]